MSDTQYSPEDIYNRAKTLYNQQIRAYVENVYDGKIVMIDVDTGDYEIDNVGVAASAPAPQTPERAALRPACRV